MTPKEDEALRSELAGLKIDIDVAREGAGEFQKDLARLGMRLGKLSQALGGMIEADDERAERRAP